MMIHGSMIWNFVNSMPQVYRGSPLVFANDHAALNPTRLIVAKRPGYVS